MTYWARLARRPHWTAATSVVAASVSALTGYLRGAGALHWWQLMILAFGLAIEALAALREHRQARHRQAGNM